MPRIIWPSTKAAEQLVDLVLRQILETTARTDARVDEF